MQLGGLLLALALSAAPVAPAAAAAPPPSTAAPLVVRDMEGRPLDLSAAMASGKAVALIFWQTWCKSCAKEAPEVSAAARAHAQAIQFVGVIAGPDQYVKDAEVARVAASWGYAFPQVRDRDLTLVNRFRVSGTPTIIVLGPDAKVAYRGARPPKDWSALAKPSR